MKFEILFTTFEHNCEPGFTIFVGPPGSGKTTLAQAVAEKSKRKCAFIHAPDLLTKYKNSGNENLRKILAPIKKAQTPCVIVLDEITQLIGHSTQNEDHPDRGDAGALWSTLDSCKRYPFIYVIGTTNSIDDLPEAFKDRLDYIIEIPRPGVKEREAILKARLLLGHECSIKKEHKCTLKDKDVPKESKCTPIAKYACDESYILELAKKSEGQSYREIERVLKQARLNAQPHNRPIQKSDIEPLIKKWSPWRQRAVNLYQNNQSRITSFCRNILPTALQVSGFFMNYYYSSSQAANSKTQLGYQAVGLTTQVLSLHTKGGTLDDRIETPFRYNEKIKKLIEKNNK